MNLLMACTPPLVLTSWVEETERATRITISRQPECLPDLKFTFTA
jgi:hypothetical protein